MTLTWEPQGSLPETQACWVGHCLGSSMVPPSPLWHYRGHHSPHLCITWPTPCPQIRWPLHLQRGVVCPELLSCPPVQVVSQGQGCCPHIQQPGMRQVAGNQRGWGEQDSGVRTPPCRVLMGESSRVGSGQLGQPQGLGDTVAEEMARSVPRPQDLAQGVQGPELSMRRWPGSRGPQCSCPGREPGLGQRKSPGLEKFASAFPSKGTQLVGSGLPQSLPHPPVVWGPSPEPDKGWSSGSVGS